MTQARVKRGSLQIAAQLDKLVAEQILPGTGIAVEQFWLGFEACLEELGPVNRALLAERDMFQGKIDAYHLARKGALHDPVA